MLCGETIPYRPCRDCSTRVRGHSVVGHGDLRAQPRFDRSVAREQRRRPSLIASLWLAYSRLETRSRSASAMSFGSVMLSCRVVRFGGQALDAGGVDPVTVEESGSGV